MPKDLLSSDSNSPLLPASPCITNEDLARKIDRVETVVKSIHISMTGDLMGNKGVIPRVDTLEDKVEKHDRKLLVWGSMIVAAGAAAEFLKDLIFHPKG
jgi:hypothetical protein